MTDDDGTLAPSDLEDREWVYEQLTDDDRPSPTRYNPAEHGSI